MRKPISISLLIFLLTYESCIIPKEARILKRTTKEWRDSKIVLYAWADTPFSGMFLTLRDNGRFEYTSSGIIRTFDTGSWSSLKDSITLMYIDGKQKVRNTQKLFIDRRTSTLVLDSVSIRLRILKNDM